MNRTPWRLEMGADLSGEGGCSFRVWAPDRQSVGVMIEDGAFPAPIPMSKGIDGYFHATVPNIKAGMRYRYILDGDTERPDPVSRSLPEGVHGPSEVVDPGEFTWTDKKWKGIKLNGSIFYEVHIGTFTSGGTFKDAIRKIPYLKRLGVTVVEIMPVAQFPGERNWGYDGAGIYAPQNSYGGPEGLKKLVDACHREGLAVCLDVVYNHLGPEGNYLHGFGPYFTNKYHTPWGDAVNFDGPHSDGVRRFVLDNALYWVTEYHIDALRLDAVHGIFDLSAKHILAELKDAVCEQASRLGREVMVIAESDLNDTRIIQSRAQGGYGLDGQWSDDFHHAVHATLTGEKAGYYRDFGGLEDILKAIMEGFVYDGKYSVCRKRRHGNSAKGFPREAFVVSIQNHDQVGNRAFGDRLSVLVSFEKQKLAAGLLMLSPATPLIFMGEEYGETANFQYFIDHGDAHLVRSVRDGRKKEFEGFGWDDIPDPADKTTFLSSKLKWDLLGKKKHKQMFTFYKDLIDFRKRISGARVDALKFKDARILGGGAGLVMNYRKKGKALGMFFSFSGTSVDWVPKAGGRWKILMDSSDPRYGGSREVRGNIVSSAVEPWSMQIREWAV